MGSHRSEAILMIDKATITSRNILEGIRRDGHEVCFTSDFEDGHSKLVNGWWHLAILGDRFVREYPPAGPDYYPGVPKILCLSQEHYFGENDRAGMLARYDFVDEVVGSNLRDITRKVNQYFTNYFHRFAWNLSIMDPAGRPENLHALAGLLSPNTSPEYQFYRAFELEDLLRRLFFEDCELTLFPPLWVEDGLAAVEAWAVRRPGSKPEHYLLKIGQKDQHDLDQLGYTACRPDSSTAGTTSTGIKEETSRFGIAICQLHGRWGHGGRLATASALLDQRANPEKVAQAYLKFVRHGPAMYFSRYPAQVDPIKTVRQHLGVPDNETALGQLVEHALDWAGRTGWVEGVGVQIDLFDSGGANIHIWLGDDSPLHLNTTDLRHILQMIDRHQPRQPATTAPAPLRLHNLIMEDIDDRLDLAWPSDFRSAGPSCGLFNLTQCEAELRYHLVRPAGPTQRLALEKQLLNGVDGAQTLTHPAALAAASAIAEVRALATPLDPGDYQAALLLHALARFNRLNPALTDARAAEDAAILLASLALVSAHLPGVVNRTIYRLEKGNRENRFIFNGSPFELSDAPAEVLNALIDCHTQDKVLTYQDYRAINNNQPEVGSLASYKELLQTYISDIREVINDMVGNETEKTGSRIIKTVKKVGYRLDLDPDAPADEEDLDMNYAEK